MDVCYCTSMSVQQQQPHLCPWPHANELKWTVPALRRRCGPRALQTHTKLTRLCPNCLTTTSGHGHESSVFGCWGIRVFYGNYFVFIAPHAAEYHLVGGASGASDSVPLQHPCRQEGPFAGDVNLNQLDPTSSNALTRQLVGFVLLLGLLPSSRVGTRLTQTSRVGIPRVLPTWGACTSRRRSVP